MPSLRLHLNAIHLCEWNGNGNANRRHEACIKSNTFIIVGFIGIRIDVLNTIIALVCGVIWAIPS